SPFCYDAAMLAALIGLALMAQAEPHPGPSPSAPALQSALRVPGPLSPRIASYRIQAELDPKTHRITGRQHLEWRNTQAVPAATLAFHLYLNAFKNEDSVFMRESRRGEGRDWQEPTAFGWIDVKSMRAGDLELRERATIARCAEDEPVT